MKRFYLRVTALSPLAIRSDQAEGGVATTHSIPGATLLGSLAAAHRMLYPELETEFARFFLTEQIHFPHLYPANFQSHSFRNSNLPVMPLPKTAQTCKRFSGFHAVVGETNVNERHGIRDSLLDWGTFALLDSEKASLPALLAPFHGRDVCTYAQGMYSNAPCQQTMQHIDGYYRRDRHNVHVRMKADANTRLQTRTGINRQWGVVEEGILYNREVFDEQTRFWGELLLPDDLANAFSKFVEEANKENLIRLGTGRTRGLGCVSVELKEGATSKAADFSEKIEKFHAAMQQRAQAVSVQQRYHFYFAITLQSPIILCDPFLRYQKTLDVPALTKLLDLSASTYPFKLIYQSVGMQRITGWNEVWGTPRGNDYAIERGSTFLYSCLKKPDTTLIQALQAMEDRGIGRRRSEGFGRITLSDPFHLEREYA